MTETNKKDNLEKARVLLRQEAMLSKPSEYGDEGQFLLDEFSLRVDLERCRDCVRKALALLEDMAEGHHQ